MAEAVKVVVRCRPMNTREKDLNSEVVVKMDSAIIQVQLIKPKSTSTPPKLFTFDGVYYMKDTTLQIYEDICFPLVSGVLEGYNGTVFAYGQTGCGKSYTMMGVQDPPENLGVIPRAFDHIFDHVAVNKSMKYLVRASYLEIYNEEVRDLLGKDAKKKLDLHEHPDKGVYVQGLSYHKVHNSQDLETVMKIGSNNRSVGATLMNVDSSRSHSIFSIDLEMMERASEEGKVRAGRLNLVDLAGSERQSKTGSTGERLKEATKINLSLSALGNVISALVDGKSKHIPYRDSKLTRLLQSSLGGNTKTLMVACISPADNNYDETLSTLRYANRAKNIKNKPKINEDPKDALLREYQEEIKQLKMMLMGQMAIPADLKGGDVRVFQAAAGSSDDQHPPPPAGIRGVAESSVDEEQLENQKKAWEEEKEAIKREYEARLAEMKEQFGQEQANKEQLKQSLDKLQQDRDEQLAKAQQKLKDEKKRQQKLREERERELKQRLKDEKGKRHKLQEEKERELEQRLQEEREKAQGQKVEGGVEEGETQKESVAIGTITTQTETETQEVVEEPVSTPATTAASDAQSAPAEAAPPPEVGVTTTTSATFSDKDKEILREQELALQRLEELQSELIGGEKVADEGLTKQYHERQEAAEQRQQELVKASTLFDEEDDNVLEKIFNSLTDEVREKTQVIERKQAKLLSAEQDIKDLCAEFEVDRQDYLDTIRNQGKSIKLFEQLLRTVVPCLRRDCNYFNMDKIRTECEWDEINQRWVLPKLVINKTALSTPLPKGSLPEATQRKGVKTTPTHKNSSRQSSSSDINVRDSSSSLLRSQGENSDDDRYMSHVHQKSDESLGYFKPKRALELLNQTHASKEVLSPIHNHASDSPLKSSGSGSLPSAAAVHGVDPLKDTGFGRRPGKLQSLARNPPVPQPLPPETDILEKVEKRLTGRKNLEPLADIKHKKPQL